MRPYVPVLLELPSPLGDEGVLIDVPSLPFTFRTPMTMHRRIPLRLSLGALALLGLLALTRGPGLAADPPSPPTPLAI